MSTVAIYLCTQIEKGKLNYSEVVARYPQFKEEIDACLIGKGLGHLIVD